MKWLVLLFIILFSTSISAQKFTGVVKSNKGKIADIEIRNITQELYSYSKENGAFSIKAMLNDSIEFNSMFYEKKIIRLTITDFEKESIINLTEKIFNLEEVIIENSLKNSKRINLRLKNEIQKDINNNPYLYEAPSRGEVDFVRIYKYFRKILKNKEKTSNKASYIKRKDLIKLFSGDSKIFTKKMLNDILKIKSDKKYLFFDYVENNKISSGLLLEDNELLLIEKLVQLANEFLMD